MDGGAERAGGSTTQTTCPYCGVGCGVTVSVDAQGALQVRGDARHPANRGALCSKGAALAETLAQDEDHADRLLYPWVHGERVDWDTALEAVAQGFAKVIAEHGPQAVAFYVSGQLLSEDYYVANKLMKGFIGAANIDTNSRLCMASAVAAQQRAFGADAVPCSYEDIEHAELIVLVGSNAAWCHPVLYQRVRRAKQQRPALKVVVIDPRRTASCDIADLHLALQPGTDAVLFNGLLNYLRRMDCLDWDFLEQHTEGFASALQSARDTAASIPEVAAACGVDENAVGQFYAWFARTAPTLTLYSQGVNQSSSGVDKANAIINCHLAAGRIGKPGAGPFSLTGQPNAMGGREVGGLANQLAAHLSFDDPNAHSLLAEFWQTSDVARLPGLKAVDLFEAVGTGEIRAVWIMATNPAVSLPDAERVREALRRCELVVVSDCVAHTDTTACAHILLPAAAWGEKDGTVTNSERRISRQRAFLAPPGEAQPDWWIVSRVAERMGFGAAFGYDNAAQIFREHARLSALANEGKRAFDIGGLADLSDADYHGLAPVQWPVTAQAPQGTPRLFTDKRFYTPNGKARFVAVTPRTSEHPVDASYPLVLNTGRVRDHWHTLTRTGMAARLSAHIDAPYVEMHPRDAEDCQLRGGDLAELSTRWGCMRARVNVSAAQRPGTVFVPMHWSDRFASHGRVGALVNPVTDPISGQPESKHTPVRVRAYAPAWRALLVSRRALHPTFADYWVRSRGAGLWRYELAGEQLPADWAQSARALLCTADEGVSWIEYLDAGQRRYRAARLVAGRLESCIFIESSTPAVARDWLENLFTIAALNDAQRGALLAGRPPRGTSDAGPTVCSCFGVGKQTLLEAIRREGLTTPEAIGRVLQAGTNCGSCVPELRSLIAASLGRSAA